MASLTFITGNQSKADYMSRYLAHPVNHQKLDLYEIQSLDIQTVVKHKVTQAYNIVGSPVIVEDISLEFEALGRLPGTFIKYFVSEIPYETICRMLDSFSRKATAKCAIGYYNGTRLELFENSLKGEISPHPRGDKGFDWDKIFIPEGYEQTRAEMNEANYRKTYMLLRPVEQLKTFLENNLP